MADWNGLLTILAAFLVVTIAPGPANLAVATTAMGQGRTAALKLGLGLGVGLAFWGIVAASGLGFVLQSSANAMFLLKIIGGIYLLWLAYNSATNAVKPAPGTGSLAKTSNWFLRGLFMNISNPKAVVAWMAALAVGFGNDTNIANLALATTACFLIGFGNYSGHALLFSLNGFRVAYARAQRWIDAMIAGLFAMIGLGLIRSAFNRS